MSYFNKFPKTLQNDLSTIDISRRVVINSEKDGELYNYVPYEVKEGERPEDVAFYYYNDASYAWLVLLANNIIDPYTSWPKSQYNLDEYIKVQYAEQANATGNAVIEWTQNTTISENILYYAHRRNGQIRISPNTYENFPTPVVDDNNPATANTELLVDQSFVAADFRPIRIYEYEEELNELRKKIILFDRRFIVEIDKSVAEVLSNE